MERKRETVRRLSKIERLSPELQTEIDERLFEKGWSAKKVERWLKEEKNVTDVGERCINDYFRKMHSVVEALRGGTYAEMTKGVAEKIDALKELYKLAQLQTRRISPLLEVEVNEKKLLPGVNREIDLLRTVLGDILTAEMNLGIRKRVAPSSDAKSNFDDKELDELMKKILPQKKKPAGEQQTQDEQSVAASTST